MKTPVDSVKVYAHGRSGLTLEPMKIIGNIAIWLMSAFCATLFFPTGLFLLSADLRFASDPTQCPLYGNYERGTAPYSTVICLFFAVIATWHFISRAIGHGKKLSQYKPLSIILCIVGIISSLGVGLFFALFLTYILVAGPQ